MENQIVIDNLESFIKLHRLDYGGSEVVQENEDRIYMVIEAPNNTTIFIDFDNATPEMNATLDELKANYINVLYKAVIDQINEFNVNDTFDEFYSSDLNIKASEFLEKLKEDEQYFKALKDKLSKNVTQ